jgi:hypothetical protein
MAVQGTVVRRPWVARASGLLITGVGIFLIKLCVLDVLAAAERQESVTMSLKGTIVAPFCVVLGVAATWAAFTQEDPRNWQQWHALTNPQTRRLTPRGWMIVIGLLGIGLGLYAWLCFKLTGLGYDVF